MEEHNIIGGLGSAVAEVTSEHCPVVVRRMGVRDRYGIPGTEEDLFAFFGLTSEHIVAEAKKLLETEESK